MGDTLYDFLHSKCHLLPQLLPFASLSSSASIHHITKAVRQEVSVIIVHCLPPYSPDYNQAFLKVK